MCDFWYFAKCQHLKADVMKLLNACKKNVHWFCDKCDDKAVGVLTNAKYKLGKQSPESYLNERIVSEIDRAMSTLHDKVREAETAMKTSYADIVKKFDSQLKTLADTNQANNQPTGATASAPDANLKELQDRQDRSKNLVVYGVPESQSKDKDNRKTHDKVHFQTICQEGLDMDVDVSDTVRLGEK